MKYIPGFQFVAGSMRQSKAPASLLERSTKRRTAVNDKDFIPGETYKIYNIKKKDDKYFYSFIPGSSEGLIELEFNSIQEAEMRIGRLIGA